MGPTIDFHYDSSTEFKLTEIGPSPSSGALIFDDLESWPDGHVDPEGFEISGSKKTWKVKVLTISKWPEFKTKICHKKVKIPFDGYTKVPYPCLWTRICKRSWFLMIGYSGGSSLPDDIEKIIEDCAKVALVVAVPILLTGNVGGAVAAFIAAFQRCLIAKGIQEAEKFSASFKTQKTCGKWKRV